jgi:pyruvate/2-oxoglutarate dehydrogenase complex dihydrolipoamide acyltransferase (E2) component
MIGVMQKGKNEISVQKFPRSRLSTVDLGRIGLHRHHIAALLEVDVTRARRQIRIVNRGGQSAVSFIAWLISNVARSLAAHPEAHAVRLGRRRIATFDSVNVSIIVEREVANTRVPLPILITGADSKPVSEIERTIQQARSEPVDPATVVIGREGGGFAMRLYYALPGFLRRGLLKLVLRNPRRLHRTMGSVVVTSVGMGGRVRGWFIPRSMQPVCIGIGAVTPKATVVNGAIEPREVLHMTVLVDHDVVDGAPAARWIAELLRTMENAKELHLN